jgi:hypothetical protein
LDAVHKVEKEPTTDTRKEPITEKNRAERQKLKLQQDVIGIV